MMMPDRMICFAATVVAALTSGLSHAALLTFHFSGEVSAIVEDDSSGTFSANFAVGNAVSGQFVIDTTSPEQVLSPEVHFYDATFSATIGAHNFSGPAQYRIFDDHVSVGDGFSIINEAGTFAGPVLGPLAPDTFFLQFLGMPNATLADFSLITDPISLLPLYHPDTAPHGLRLQNVTDGSFGLLYLTIESVRPRAAVPESGGGFWLLGVGLLALIGFRKVALRGV